MAKVYEYPEIETLNESFYLYLDSETYGSRSINVADLLRQLFELDGSAIPSNMFSYRDINELAVPGESTYLASKASPNSVYFISSSTQAQAFTDFPSGFNSSALLLTFGRTDRFVQFLIKNSTVPETIYYRNWRNSSTRWGVLGGGKEAPTMTSPTMSSGFSRNEGGYNFEGNTCRVEMAFTNTSQLLSGTVYEVASGFPVPSSNPTNGVALACSVTNVGLNVKINHNGKLVVTPFSTGVAASSTIVVTGTYYSNGS